MKTCLQKHRELEYCLTYRRPCYEGLRAASFRRLAVPVLWLQNRTQNKGFGKGFRENHRVIPSCTAQSSPFAFSTAPNKNQPHQKRRQEPLTRTEAVEAGRTTSRRCPPTQSSTATTRRPQHNPGGRPAWRTSSRWPAKPAWRSLVAKNSADKKLSPGPHDRRMSPVHQVGRATQQYRQSNTRVLWVYRPYKHEVVAAALPVPRLN